VIEMAVQVSLTETSFAVEVDKDEFGKISDTDPTNRLDLSSIRNGILASEFFEYVPQSTGNQSFGNTGSPISVPF
jgi:hypothetical protein